MNKRKSILESARTSMNLPDNDSKDCERMKIVVEALSRYFEIYDMDNGTIHSQVFSMLYLSQKRYTYKVICEKLHISKNTLVRYVTKYEELALKILNRLNI